MKTLPTLSPDVTIAGEPTTQRKGKAKTPSGRGHGFADDIQRYPQPVYDPARSMRDAATVALAFIRGHAKQAGWTGEDEVRRAVDALGELVEWTKGR